MGAVTIMLLRMGRRSSGQRDPDAQSRRSALGASIREARKPLNQTEFGDLLKPLLGERVPQTTLSRWELGEIEMTLEQVRAIELALGLELGSLAKRSGYL